ncbi:MAG: protein kinase [Myxococcota bacterium]|nr:protein kinase [Myxococcota bacterium]
MGRAPKGAAIPRGAGQAPEAAESYELLSLLGTGGMGEVYLARPRSDPQARVALKRLRGDRAASPEHRAQFEREARIGVLLRHPNIAPVLALGQDEEGPFLVMEYVDGCSLERLLGASGPAWTDAELAAVGVSVARALEAAHGLTAEEGKIRGVLHRDVSADNVLLSRQGEVKLTDFGVARLVGATALTRTGEVKGKISYLAPEIFEGAEATPASDLWALGVTLFRAVCGIDPFGGDSQAKVIHSVLHARPPPLATLRPQLPRALAEVIEACLARDPRQRPSAAEVARRLLPLCGAGVSTQLANRVLASAPPKAEWVPHKARTQTVMRKQGAGRRSVWLGAAVILALVAGGGGWWGINRRWIEQEIVGARPTDEGPSVTAPSPSEALPESHGGTSPGQGGASAIPAVPDAQAGARSGQSSATVPASRGGVKQSPSQPSSPASSRPRPTESRGSVPSQDAPRPEPAADTLGLLSIKVRPWGRVFIDGKLVGTTPLAPLPIAAGIHTVVIVNEELGERRQQQVRIPPGGTETLRLFLDQPAPEGP